MALLTLQRAPQPRRASARGPSSFGTEEVVSFDSKMAASLATESACDVEEQVCQYVRKAWNKVPPN